MGGGGGNTPRMGVATTVPGSAMTMMGSSWEGVVVSIQIRCLGLMLILWASVGSVGVVQCSHIKTTLDLGFSHAIALKLFYILRAQVILEVSKRLHATRSPGNWSRYVESSSSTIWFPHAHLVLTKH